MPQLVSFGRITLSTTFVLALASACGGQSFSGNGGDAGSSAQGGTSSEAGTTSTAGKVHAGRASGGSSTGGTGNVGGSSSAGTGNVGGSVGNEACNAPPFTGTCEGLFPSWYHDPATGLCRPFIYGGCDGNANRYDSLEACQKACPGGNPDYDACKVPTDCVVAGTGCCGICDGPNITAHDLIAYNKNFAGFLQCAGGGPLPAGAGDPGAGVPAPIACAPCPLPPAGQGTLMYFVPNCVAGQCVVEDIRQSPITACMTANECKLRHGTGCCEGCSSADLISVRNDGSLEKLVCGSGPVGCPACAPPPADAIAVCQADGRCGVAYFAQGTGASQ